MLTPPPQPLSLEIKELTVRCRDGIRVKNVSLSVTAGGTLALMGPVNSGKSEILWAANGLLAEVPGMSITGQVLIDGIDNHNISVKELRHRVGLLIPVSLSRTPYSEVAVSLRSLSSPAQEVAAKVEWALRLVGLWKEVRDRLHQPYNHADPTLLRLLCLARTIARQPGLLLLDDPTRGLDSISRARFEDAVVRILAEGFATIIWGTREPDQAGRVAGQIAFLYNGELVESGSARCLFEFPRDPRTESFLTGDYRRLYALAGSEKRRSQP
ncbi:MAG TPA: ATP-binding cassette domain-containing protein [Firmicutes bacterium]|nr:ATP-binding cassette domain-containing protein [Bacillota bacterium]